PRIHWAGLYEASNRQNLSGLGGWSERAEAKTVALPVCVVSTDKYRKLNIPFDVRTMQIEAHAQAALESGGSSLRAYLPTPVKQPAQLQPAPENSEPISEEERRQILGQIRSLIKPMSRATETEQEQSTSDQII
ncbi:MAG TPA: hypothetical protein VJ302_23285, partial [Blastocatellia bacterium]|nr:hypothetical protein [Blastocatellia bacterium]